ncbi:MAG: aspartate aminotransferase family protein [Verrucomicrobiota bacterium]|jgi:glutamate-1-semialdehyde 2,1-aminomutase
MTHDYSRSRQLYERALGVLPGGVSRNTVLRRPHPLYASKGEGCYLTDVEGHRRIDFANNMASLIHGHAHPVIVEAVSRQIQKGTGFTFATEVEVELAEHMTRRTKGFDKIRFVNSGTEAVMCCLKAARAYTGRPKIAKVEGAYHGLYDYAEVSQTAQPANWGEAEQPRSIAVAQGTPASVLDEVIVIPFNNPKVALAILDRHAGELACVLVDPMPHRIGFIPAAAAFIGTLRKWTRQHGALLVFDEVITYRLAYGGAQEWFGEEPDLTALGKMIGGGFPVGAVTGRKEVMEVFNPLAEKVLFPHSGTFSANPITMTAGLAAMEYFDREQVAKINRLGEGARRQIGEAIRSAGIPACVTGGGSIFRIHMKAKPPRNYRESYVTAEETRLMRALIEHALEEGIILIGTCSGTLSTPMNQPEIDRLTGVLLSGFRKIKAMPAELAAVEQRTGRES